MKFDLLLSDLVAYCVGFLGLVAAIIALQNAMVGAFAESAVTGAVFALAAILFFVPARRFLVARAYEAMLARAALWQKRIPFIILNCIWIGFVTVFLVGTKPHDLFGASEQIPWLFSPLVLVPIVVLFVIVFVAPGTAFRPYRVVYDCEEREEAPAKRGLITAMRHNRNAILIDSHPTTEKVCKIAEVLSSTLVVVCGIAFFFSDTHASTAYLEQSKILLVVLTTVFFVLLYLPRNYGLRMVPDTGEVLFSAKRKLINVVGILAMSFGLAHVPYFYLIPWGYNHLIATETDEIAYQVDGKVDYKGCRNGLRFAYADNSGKSFHVCSVDTSVRERVSAGDTVLIHGKISRYGHSAGSLRVAG